jgi:acylphosphatase
MMNTSKKIGLFLISVLLSACMGSPQSSVESAPASTTANPVPVVESPDQLDAAIRETSDYLNKQLPHGNKLVILNIQSDFPALSEYIIDELIANTVNDRIFSVVDRQQLNTIRQELNFQFSGEVDDETAQALGRMAGAQIIVSGAVSRIGNMYRLRVRALQVQSAEIEGQFNRNIPDGSTVQALVQSKATGYGGESAITESQPGANSASIPVEKVSAPAKRGTAYNGNGHSYEVFNQTMSWTEARRYCERLEGYLATITSSGEQTFIENLLAREGSKNMYWLGGYTTGGFRYQWVTGEPFTYTNWSSAALRNSHEDKLMIYRVPNSQYSGSFGMWEDDTNEGQESFYKNTGFICEFD